MLARNETLTTYEKIGFPTSYREGKEHLIFEDIVRKLPALGETEKTVLDIGAGCSGPAFSMIDLCKKQRHQLILVDSDEMLRQLPDVAGVAKVIGRYPDQCSALFEQHLGGVDIAVCYSVLHYIFNETNLFDFIDRSLALLSPGGQMLIGDIPNVSKRKRFFSSPTGVRFHQAFTGTSSAPEVNFNRIERTKIDDSVLLGMLMRVRAAGCEAYLVPQPADLPMANRREDFLIHKP